MSSMRQRPNTPYLQDSHVQEDMAGATHEPSWEDDPLFAEDGDLVVLSKDRGLLDFGGKIESQDYGDEKEGYKEKDLEPVFGEDTYAMFYMSKLGTQTSFFAACSLIMQVGLIFTLFFDLYDFKNPTDTNDEANAMRVPAGVPLSVTAAQLAAMFLTVYLMVLDGDTLAGIAKLLEGYDEGILEACPHAVYPKWLFTAILQIVSGLGLTVSSFFLMMQSEDVINLILNFTGLHLLQEVDNFSFRFAATGIVGMTIQEDCQFIREFKQYVPPNIKRRILVATKIYAVALLVALLGPFFYVAKRQATGDHLCSNIYVQFGDYYYPEYAYYSGIFKEKSSKPFGEPPVYAHTSNSSSSKLEYCQAEQAWTFSFNSADSCKNFTYKSSPTKSFDVMEVAEQTWYVKPSETHDFPADWLKMVCQDCTKKRCKGHCKDGKCIPNKKMAQGLNFEFNAIACDAFNVSIPFHSRTPGQPASAQHYILKPLGFKEEKQVISKNSNGSTFLPRLNNFLIHHEYSTNLFTLAFTGRRWTLFKNPGRKPKDIMELVDDASNPIETLYRMEKEGFEPYFFSSPVDYGTETYSPGPLRLKWYYRKYDKKEKIFFWVADDSKEAKDMDFTCSDVSSTVSCATEGSECWHGAECANSALFDKNTAYLASYKLIEGLFKHSLEDAESNDRYCRCPFSTYGHRCQYDYSCQSNTFAGRNGRAEKFALTDDYWIDDDDYWSIDADTDKTDEVESTCLRGGVCGSNGACLCPEDTFGGLCEYREGAQTERDQLPCLNAEFCVEYEGGIGNPVRLCGCICSDEFWLNNTEVCTATAAQGYCNALESINISEPFGNCNYATEAEKECYEWLCETDKFYQRTFDEYCDFGSSFDPCYDITERELECRMAEEGHKRVDDSEGFGNWWNSTECETGSGNPVKTVRLCREVMKSHFIAMEEKSPYNTDVCLDMSRRELGCRIYNGWDTPDCSLDDVQEFDPKYVEIVNVVLRAAVSFVELTQWFIDWDDILGYAAGPTDDEHTAEPTEAPSTVVTANILGGK